VLRYTHTLHRHLLQALEVLTRAYGLHDARVAFALHNLGGFYLSQVGGAVAFGVPLLHSLHHAHTHTAFVALLLWCLLCSANMVQCRAGMAQWRPSASASLPASLCILWSCAAQAGAGGRVLRAGAEDEAGGAGHGAQVRWAECLLFRHVLRTGHMCALCATACCCACIAGLRSAGSIQFQLRMAFAPAPRSETSNSMYHLAEVRWQQGQHDAAVRLTEHSLEIMEAQVGGFVWLSWLYCSRLHHGLAWRS